MYWIKTPRSIKSILPGLTWNLEGEKDLYITFDDGPIPGVTDEILNLLVKYNARATFFCIGENVVRHQELFERIKAENHAIGNHTFNHLNGWKTKDSVYFQNVAQCDTVVHSRLFRPPYGRIGVNQARHLTKDFAIIMWDVLSGDFDLKLTWDTCAQNVIQNAIGGSIVVFHDSQKAKQNVLGSLPIVLEHFSNSGFSFKSIES